MLESIVLILVVVQIVLSWIALDRLPGTTVPYYGPARSMGLPAAVVEARIWTWTVVGLWSMMIGASLLLYRSIRSTPIPIFSAALFALLAVLRAGAIALNLNPTLSPRQVLLRGILAGVITLMLAVMVERWRSRKKLPPALITRARYDEATPKGASFVTVVILGLGIPFLLIPTRVRVIAAGVLVVTPVSYFLIPGAAVARVERAGMLQALFGAGINLTGNPASAVRLFRTKRFFPLVMSVTDPDRFIDAVREFKNES